MSVITFTVTAGGKATIPKAPGARKLYGIELADVLAEANTTIASASVSGQEGVIADGAVEPQGTLLLLWVKGGTLGQVGYITFHYYLSDGSDDYQTLYFDIVKK